MAPYPIYLFTFEAQHLLASTFCRFQEFYESPKFRGKAFTWEEFIDWYAAERGAFTYFQDWDGFNLPTKVFDRFLAKDGFAPLMEKELALLACVRDLPRPSYVIAAVAGQQATMNHEIVHGLYACVPKYRRDVLKVIRSRDLMPTRKALAATGGYHSSVHDDEINANALTGWSWLKGARLGAVRPELDKVFRRHFGVSPRATGKLLELIHVRPFGSRI